MKREKVIKGLLHCTSHDDGRDKFGGVGKCGGCPYYGHDCTDRMKKDVLELLKEQDPVETELEGGGSTWWYVCGECHGAIDQNDNYCKHCGRRIKHEKKAE